MIRKILKTITKHKIITFIVIIVLVVGGFYTINFLKKQGGQTKYVLAAVEKGMIISSVSGSGQISALNQIDIKSKVSGDVVYLNIKNGQDVKAGALLATIYSQDAQRSVRDAEANLESAKISLEKLKQPADELSLLQAENALTQANQSKQDAQDNLERAYEDGFNNVANVFLELPGIMSGLQSILLGNDRNLGGTSQWNIDYYADAVKSYDAKSLEYRDDAYQKYQLARQKYDQNFQDYKSASRFSEKTAIETLISETYDTTKSIAEAVKSSNNLIQFYKDKLTERNLNYQSLADTHLSSLNSYTGKTNNFLINLLNIENTIKDSQNSLVSADRSITEKTMSLARLKAGADSLDFASQELNIEQRENALLYVKEKLNDYYIRAPFDGMAAQVNVKKGDSISAGSAVATVITKKQIAEISLNEVDIAKIKVGQKVTLTFDAISELTISGEVLEMDAIGTVNQGVVNYNVKIGFDTEDDRVRPGMSVSAAIIIDSKQDVLLVPNSAVKSQGNNSYVELLNNEDKLSEQLLADISSGASVVLKNSLNQQSIEVGLSNDSYTEVVSGLSESDIIVLRTVTNSSSVQIQSQNRSLLQTGGSTRNNFPRD